MSRLKFYKFLAGLLLLLNIGVLAFFVLSKPKPHKPTPPRPGNFQDEVVKILDLDDAQMATFRQLADNHHQQMRSINEQQQGLLSPYFENLVSPTSDINEDSLLNHYQRLDRDKIETTYQHFQDIKEILREDQAPHFEPLIRNLVDKMLLGRQKRPPRREGK